MKMSCLLPVLLLAASGVGLDADTAEEANTLHASTNFDIWYQEPDAGYPADIAEALESSYARVTGGLGMQGAIPRVKLLIYPSLEEFHSAINRPGSPNWLLGTIWSADEIRMCSPLAQDLPVGYEDMAVKLPVHEFAHIVVAHIAAPESIPYWLWEGVSLYMAGQRVELGNLDYIRKGEYPGFEELGGMQYSFQLGYALVEYIIARWGTEVLKPLIASGGAIEEVLQIPKETFYLDWQEFVTEEYLGM